MSIEFPCAQCGKLLRVGDEAAGKQARCPSCGAVQSIPFKLTAGDGSTFPLANSGGGFGPMGNTANPPPFDQLNPYASPMAVPGRAPDHASGKSSSKRNGPPWERDEASWDSFWDTAKAIYSSPPCFFREMRRKGGLAPPLLYALSGAMIGGAASICYRVGFRIAGLQVLGVNARDIPGRLTTPSTLIIVGLLVWLIAVPLWTVFLSFVGSGMFHLCLQLVGGARRAYETTFRVLSYSVGSAALFGLLPICGGYVHLILILVFSGIGLAYCHDTTAGKATLAVLLPALVCCGAFVAFFFAVVGLAIVMER